MPFYNDRVCFREETKNKMWRRSIVTFRHLSSAVAVFREWLRGKTLGKSLEYALSGHGAPALKDPYTDYIVSICRLYEHEFDRFCDSFESATDPKHQPGMLASSSEIDGPPIDSNTS